MFCRPEYQCVESTNVPLNQTTQIEHRVTSENCESAISNEETYPDSDDCLETEIIIEYDNSITLETTYKLAFHKAMSHFAYKVKMN